MKCYTDQKRVDKEYHCGNMVYLKIQPYKEHTLANTSFYKLATRYYGPYKVLQRIGNVAYRLELLVGTKIHNVFHVSLLKKYHGNKPDQLPLLNEDGEFLPRLVAILDKRIKKKNNKAVTEVLIQWRETNPGGAVWRELCDSKFNFQILIGIVKKMALRSSPI
uniref:Tf2-1-like SH3-like domain-containing protein n=1 Tax=Cajanus cajan TaxID=3821 RepID=A0A151RHH1_CAJCA|nr:hypothetical protein KK1_036743 [Cajanus cajan]